MKITVKTVGPLSDLFRQHTAVPAPTGKEHEYTLVADAAPITVRALLRQYQVDTSRIGVVTCNGQLVTLDHPVHDGDYILLLPLLAGG